VCVCVCVCSTGEKPFSVGLVDQRFQPASNQVETFEKAFAWLRCMIVVCIWTIRKS